MTQQCYRLMQHFHSLDSEVLCCQPGIVNLQHQPGIVICGSTDLKQRRKRHCHCHFLSTYNTTHHVSDLVCRTWAGRVLWTDRVAGFTPDLHSTVIAFALDGIKHYHQELISQKCSWIVMRNNKEQEALVFRSSTANSFLTLTKARPCIRRSVV